MILETYAPIYDLIMDDGDDDYPHQDNIISVTDLTYCMRKSYNRRKNYRQPKFKSRWYLRRGEIFHGNLADSFPRHDIHVGYSIDHDIIITGRADAIGRRNGENEDRVLEFKTQAETARKGLREYDRLQAGFYGYCLGLPSRVIYCTLIDATEFDVDFSANDLVLIEMRAKLLSKALELNTPEIVLELDENEKWMCRDCEYSDFCKEEK